jgi:hypothetical protein
MENRRVHAAKVEAVAARGLGLSHALFDALLDSLGNLTCERSGRRDPWWRKAPQVSASLPGNYVAAEPARHVATGEKDERPQAGLPGEEPDHLWPRAAI